MYFYISSCSNILASVYSIKLLLLPFFYFTSYPSMDFSILNAKIPKLGYIEMQSKMKSKIPYYQKN